MNTLLKYWKDYLIVALIIAGIGIAYVANHYYQQAADKKQIAKAEKVLADPTEPIVDKFADSLGQYHSEIKADDNDVTQAAMNDTAAKRKRLIDTVKRALNLANVNQIQELTQEVIQLKAQIKLKSETDSNGKKTLNYSDKWLSFIYNPLDSSAYLTYNARLNSVYFYKKSWIPFVKNVDYIDFYGDDPRMTVNGVKHFKVIPPAPLFGISADARATYLFSKAQLIPSVGLRLRISNFFMEGREYYSPSGNSGHQLLSAGYQIGTR